MLDDYGPTAIEDMTQGLKLLTNYQGSHISKDLLNALIKPSLFTRLCLRKKESKWPIILKGHESDAHGMSCAMPVTQQKFDKLLSSFPLYILCKRGGV